MEDEEYVRLFELEDKLWWFLGMRHVSFTLLDRFVSATRSDRRILDVGCGTGGMLETLRLYGQTFGADVSPQALRFARMRASAPLLQADICRLPFTSGSFDVVTSFDVIYHLGVSSDDSALLEIARVLRPDGVFLLRVPALNLFRGRHDVAVHTRHRYGRREIEEKLIRAGFTPVFVSYVNCFLLPLAALRRVADRMLRPAHRGSEVEPVAPWLNQALYSFLLLEAKWIRSRSLPVGLSLVAVSRKRPATADPHANANSAHLSAGPAF
jgi:SAM-dependent methyltransferase